MKPALTIYPAHQLDLMQFDMEDISRILSDQSPFADSNTQSLEEDLLHLLQGNNFNLRKKYDQELYLLSVLGFDFFTPVFTHFYDNRAQHQKEIEEAKKQFIHLLKDKYRIEKPLQVYLQETEEKDETSLEDLPEIISEYPEFEHSSSLQHRVETAAETALRNFAQDQDVEQHYALVAFSLLCPPAFGIDKPYIEQYKQLKRKHEITQEFVIVLPKVSG